MDTTIEFPFALVAVLPALYGIVCWIRRGFNARNVRQRLMEEHPEEWERLHWIARRNARAGVEVLIATGLVSEVEVEKYRARDDYLEKATWIGLFVSAVLLVALIALKGVITLAIER